MTLVVRSRVVPQGNIESLGISLPWFSVRSPRQMLWLVAAHGGAGVSTLCRSAPGLFASAGRRWPQGACCAVVARTSAGGLLAAQGVLTDWAAGHAGTARLLGLILIDDAPGRLPKPLADLAHLVSGGAPAAWRIGWNHAWRCGEPAASTASPAVRRLIAELGDRLIATASVAAATENNSTIRRDNHGSRPR